MCNKARISRNVRLVAAALLFTALIALGIACDTPSSTNTLSEEPSPAQEASGDVDVSNTPARSPTTTPVAATHVATVTPSPPAYDPLENRWVLTGGMTTLHWSVLMRNVDAVEFSLNRGADINAKAGIRNRDTDVFRSEVTPLHVAALTNTDTRLVELLLAEGADIHSKSDLGDSLLHLWAIANTSTAVANLLLERGANLEARDNKGSTPLF